MSNTMTALIPKILTDAAVIFRNNSITANLVNRGYDAEFQQKGNTINVPNYTSAAVQDVTPGRGNENTPTDIVAANVPVVLDQWKEVKIQFTDKELKEIESGRPSEALRKSVITLVDYVDTWALNLMYVGSFSTAGTAASAFSDPATLVDGRTKLGLNNVPIRDRRSIINPTVAGAFIKDANLSDVSQAGNPDALRDATIGRLYGSDIYESNGLTNFTGGTLSDGTSKDALIAATCAVGATSITFDESTLTGTLVAGDIFTKAGDTQEYVVTTGSTASANSITVSFQPANKIAGADGDAVTFLANQTAAGVLFHESAFIFGSAPTSIEFTGGNLVQAFTDPLSNITFTYEVERVNKNTEHSLSILYGGDILKREGLVRLMS